MLRADVSRKRDLAIKRHRAERVEHRMFVKTLLEGVVLVFRRHGYALPLHPCAVYAQASLHLPAPVRCILTPYLPTLPLKGGNFFLTSYPPRRLAYPGSHSHRHNTLPQALARRQWASTKS